MFLQKEGLISKLLETRLSQTYRAFIFFLASLWLWAAEVTTTCLLISHNKSFLQIFDSGKTPEDTTITS